MGDEMRLPGRLSASHSWLVKTRLQSRKQIIHAQAKVQNGLFPVLRDATLHEGGN
jgi:hypothetical protein